MQGLHQLLYACAVRPIRHIYLFDGFNKNYAPFVEKLAARLGRPSMSAQAVGGAVGHNPISIIIPCHRVVGSSGSLTGYAGGLEKKAALLALEGADLQHLLTDGAWNTGP